MQTFIMFTRLSPDAVKSPKSLEEIEKKVMNKVRTECPDIEWVHNFAVMGPYDYVDIFRAPNELSAFKLSTLVRSLGHCTTEIWGATEWARFKDVIHDLAKAA